MVTRRAHEREGILDLPAHYGIGGNKATTGRN
jgi:hypothetical protein